jgi:NAD(P)H-dependent FMN reductase
MPTLNVVIASTRPGRIGLPVGTWFAQAAREHEGFDVEVTDLAELDLPFLDEPAHPRLRTYEREHTFVWSARVEASDAFVFVLPEYNHSFTAPLKNALDFLHHEWRYKPLGFVSYGGVAAGTRAVQALKPSTLAVKLFPVVEAVNVPFVAQFVDDGVFMPNELLTDAATAMLDELVRVEASLRPLRAA